MNLVKKERNQLQAAKFFLIS